MSMYGVNGVPIDEAIRPKGQEYRQLSKVVDKDGNIVGKDYADSEKMATTSLGKGGVLDSVAQNHIENIDLEKEKILSQSSDILNEYSLYIGGQIEKAANEYSDNSKSQLEKRMLEDLSNLTHMGLSQEKISKLVCGEYYGFNNLGVDLDKLDKETLSADDSKKASEIIRTILRMRINYVNKITSLMAQMLKINYKALGLSEEQAKIYIDSLTSRTNTAVKSAGEIKELIKKNSDKFMINNGEAVDLRSLGFGVILGPTKGYKLDFAGTDGTNKEGMMSLLQQAIRYDAVVVAHGSDSNRTKESLEYERIMKETRIDLNKLEKDINQKFVSTSYSIDETTEKQSNWFFKKIDSSLFFESNLSEIKEIFEKNRNSVNVFKEYIENSLDKKYWNDLDEEYINYLEAKISDSESDDEEAKFQDILNNYKNHKDIFKKLFKLYYTSEIVSYTKSNLYKIFSDENMEYYTEKKYWGCQPTRTLKAGPFTDVNELVRQLIKEGFKKILIEDCNPGGHKLAKDIMDTKGVLINHSDFSNYVEASLVDSNDENLLSIEESEASLRVFAESYDIDYNDDEYLEECCQWCFDNQEIIQEGVIDSLKEFFKKIVAGIINILKKIFNFIKKAFYAIRYLFQGSKEEPKDTKTKFQKPLKAPQINIKSQKIEENIAQSREELNAIGEKMAKEFKEVSDKLNRVNQTSIKNLERDINELEKKIGEGKHESFGGFNILDKYFLEDADLFDVFDFIHEFEAEGQSTEDEEEDFSMDDEGGSEGGGEDQAQSQEPPAEEGEEEFSMDDEGGEQPAPANEPPAEDAPAAEDGEEEFSMDDEGGEQPPAEEGEENYELPDDEGGEQPADDGEEEFSMDDEGGSEGGEGGEQPAGDDQAQGEAPAEGEDTETNTKLKELESVIFDELTEEEKNMKITELKALYITVYKKCGTISDMLTGIRKDEETIQIVEYISNTLIDLKEYVNDYINKVFDVKTYVENLAQLQKYIMIFNAISKVFDQIKAENEE